MSPTSKTPFQVVAFVASAGGYPAVATALRGLPEGFRIPIVVMQHLSPQSTKSVDVFRSTNPLPVEFLQNGGTLRPGVVLVAPAGVFVEFLPDGSCAFSPCERGALDDPLSRMLDSLARSFGPYAIGVVLTGMGDDGARGARHLHDTGGRVLVQSPESAEHVGMPRAAIQAGAADLVVPLEELGHVIGEIASGTRNPRLQSEVEAVEGLFGGPGLARAQLREVDWSATSLGPVHTWEKSLRAIVRTVLTSREAMVIRWGRERVTICNDAYLPQLGELSNPQGQPSEALHTAEWEVVSAELKKVELSGEATVLPNQLWTPVRDSLSIESYFTTSYSPLHDDAGAIAGVLSTSIDTTPRVLVERRMKTLSAVAESTGPTATPRETCERAVEALARNTHDLPLSLIYLLDRTRRSATLVAAKGVEPGSPAAPRLLDLRSEAAVWPVGRATRGEPSVLVKDLVTRLSGLVVEPWPEPLASASVIPLTSVAGEPPVGAIVLGHSPRLVMDAAYADFLSQIAVRVTARFAEAQFRQRERERLEGLSELDRLKTDFFANVSHEFRTPLTLLLAPLDQLLRQRDALPAALVPEVDLAARNSRRLLGLVNNLLDFSQIESRRRQANLEVVDLCGVLTDVVSAFRSAIESAGLTLRLECDPAIPPVPINREMWERVVSNLLSNAFKFTFEGEIAVVLRKLALHAELEIADTGVGIPTAELPNIFKRFHRVRGARARTAEGSGIGLAIVQDLVERMGGQIRVQSREGRGTTFTIWMPFKPNAYAKTVIATPEPHPNSAGVATELAEQASRWLVHADRQPENPEGVAADLLGPPASAGFPFSPGAVEAPPRGRIVVADDNADLREYLRRLLAPRWDVEVVGDGQAALDAIRRARPDVLLADVMMPNMDGFELLKRIRSEPELQHLPVMLVTARAGEEAAIEGLLAGADDYIAKPFSPRELVARVRAVIDRAQVDAALRESEKRLADELGTMTGLHALADWLLSITDLSIGLGEILDAAIGLFRADRGTIQTLEARRNVLRYVASRGFDEAALRTIPPIDRDFHSTCAATIRTGERVVVADLQSAPEWAAHAPTAASLGYRAAVSVPMKTRRDELLGVLTVHFREPGAPTDRELRWLELHARLAANLIERDRVEAALRESERRLADELKTMTALHALADRLLAIQDLRVGLGEILDAAIGLFRADRGTIQTLETRGDVLRYVASRGFDEAALRDIPPIDRDFHSTCAATIRTGERVVVADLQSDPEWAAHAPTAASLGYRAAVSVPMKTRRDELLGVLTVHFREPGAPTDRELRWLELHARLAANLIERDRVEAALRESEEKYRTLFDSMAEGYLVADVLFNAAGKPIDIEYVASNAAAIHMVGVDLTGQRLRDVSAAYEEYWYEIWGRVAVTGKSEQAVRYASPEQIWYEFNVFKLEPDNPESRRVAVLFQDVTSRVRADAAVRESEENYRTLIERMSQGYDECEMIRDVNGRAIDYRIVDMNPAFGRIIGVDVNTARGRTAREIIPGLEDGWVDLMDEVVRSGEARRIEGEVTSLGKWFDVHLYPKADDRFVAMFEDITERKRAEAVLRESEALQAYLLQLNDALRPLIDPETIQREAMRLLGERLGVSRAQYYTADETGEYLSSSGGYTDGAPAAIGRFRLIEFGKYAYDGFHAGETQVVSDARIDPRISETVLKSYETVGFLAYIGVPFVQRGRFLGTIAVHQACPRQWTESERIMVEETAVRAGMAVEQARAELALRESEGRQSFLLRLSDALRPLTEAGEMAEVAARMLGEHLGVPQADYTETNGDGDGNGAVRAPVDGPHVDRPHTREFDGNGNGHSPRRSQFRPEELGERFGEAARSGRTVVANDVEADSTIPGAERDVLAAVAIRAYVAVPLLRDGEWMATLTVHSPRPRGWTPVEVALVEETAERTWRAVEAARAAAAFRER